MGGEERREAPQSSGLGRSTGSHRFVARVAAASRFQAHSGWTTLLDLEPPGDSLPLPAPAAVWPVAGVASGKATGAAVKSPSWDTTGRRGGNRDGSEAALSSYASLLGWGKPGDGHLPRHLWGDSYCRGLHRIYFIQGDWAGKV